MFGIIMSILLQVDEELVPQQAPLEGLLSTLGGVFQTILPFLLIGGGLYLALKYIPRFMGNGGGSTKCAFCNKKATHRAFYTPGLGGDSSLCAEHSQEEMRSGGALSHKRVR